MIATWNKMYIWRFGEEMEKRWAVSTVLIRVLYYQSKTISEHKYVSYDAQLCPVIAKGQRALNAQLTHQIVNRHHEELKSSGPDSQTLKNPF